MSRDNEPMPLPYGTYYDALFDQREKLQARVAELEAQISTPVAWSVRDKHRRFITESAARAAEYESLGQTIVPLYGRAISAECDCPAEKMPFGRCCKAPPSTAAQPADDVVRDAEIARIVDAMESVAGPGAPYASASVPRYAVLGWAEQIRDLLAASAQSSKKEGE